MTDFTDPRFATTLGRGLSILRAFRVTDDGLSNAEIAERTGLPKSTISRLTYTLGSLGYLVQSPRDDRFRPGPTLVAVGEIAASSLFFLGQANELMEKLAREMGVLVVLAVRDGDKMVLIRTWRPSDVATLWLAVGQRIAMRPYASWRAFLAASPKAEAEMLIAQHAETDWQAALSADRSDAAAQLRVRGFVMTATGPGAPAPYNAVSVPFYSGNLAEPVVFVSGALPEQAPIDRIETEIGPKLAAAVRSLEHLSGQLPGSARLEA